MLVDIVSPHFLHKTDLRKTGKTGKLYDVVFGFLTVDFVLALHALPKGCEILLLKFDCEIPRGFGEIKVYTFGIGYFNERG